MSKLMGDVAQNSRDLAQLSNKETTFVGHNTNCEDSGFRDRLFSSKGTG